MCALTALCSVYCVVSSKQSQRLQTGLRLRDRNAIISLMILIVSTGANRRDFWTERYQWINMQTGAPCYPMCAISQTMKSQGRSVLQYNAKQDLILTSNEKH